MRFSKEEIDYFNKKDIPIDCREYATNEVSKLIDFVDFNSELNKKMWFEVFGPPTSIRWASLEQRKMWPKEIKKEDITNCPYRNGKLEILNDKKYQFYNCTNKKCDYKSYIIDKEFVSYLVMKDRK